MPQTSRAMEVHRTAVLGDVRALRKGRPNSHRPTGLFVGFFAHTKHFLYVDKEIVAPALQYFDGKWKHRGVTLGWGVKEVERKMVANDFFGGGGGGGENEPKKAHGVDISHYDSPVAYI